MRTSLKSVVAQLDARAEHEWAKLQELYKEAGDTQAVGEQRARWAAYDTALEIAKGFQVTSVNTEQRSV